MEVCIHGHLIIADQGFIQRRGGPWNFPPPVTIFPTPEILKLSMVTMYMLLDISMSHQNVRKFCPKLHQKQSERYINSNFSWGGGACPQTPLVGMHAFRTLSYCYHPVFPSNSKSCMKPCWCGHYWPIMHDRHYIWEASNHHIDKASHLTVFCARGSRSHFPVIPAQLMRLGIGQNTSCAVNDFA